MWSSKARDSAKSYMSGIIPLAKSPLALKSSGSGRVSDEELSKVADLLTQTLLSVEQFRNHYQHWFDERNKCISEIEELAKSIDKHHRNISIAQLPTSAVGIVGGVLTITGLALIPVTFRASIGLSISGAVFSISAAATGIVTSATDIGVQVDRVKKAKAICIKHSETTKEMAEIINELLKTCTECAEITSDEAASALLWHCWGKCTRSVLCNITCAASIGASAGHTLPHLAKTLHLLHQHLGVTVATGAAPLHVANTASKVAVHGVNLAALSGKALSHLGHALSAIGALADVLSAGLAILNSITFMYL